MIENPENLNPSTRHLCSISFPPPHSPCFPFNFHKRILILALLESSGLRKEESGPAVEFFLNRLVDITFLYSTSCAIPVSHYRSSAPTYYSHPSISAAFPLHHLSITLSIVPLVLNYLTFPLRSPILCIIQ